ncbi:MAG: UvrD-helicase domain-containing protein, partial [Acidobacteria bacterium]|nr:UvrD-helicase domain-containing protein [Acidobacteriota bacterium]
MEKIKSLLKMNDLPDKNERKKAIDTNRSFVVVAPAGSGKTQLLIKRYLTFLQKARAIDSVICLTYTRKATEEMRERVFKAIKNCQTAKPTDDNEKELFEIAKKVYENMVPLSADDVADVVFCAATRPPHV